MIDTPGLLDTKGLNADAQNIENILNQLQKINEIHAVCLVHNGTDAKNDIGFRYYIEEIKLLFPYYCIKNFIFCFTNVLNPKVINAVSAFNSCGIRVNKIVLFENDCIIPISEVFSTDEEQEGKNKDEHKEELKQEVPDQKEKPNELGNQDKLEYHEEMQVGQEQKPFEQVNEKRQEDQNPLCHYYNELEEEQYNIYRHMSRNFWQKNRENFFKILHYSESFIPFETKNLITILEFKKKLNLMTLENSEDFFENYKSEINIILKQISKVLQNKDFAELYTSLKIFIKKFSNIKQNPYNKYFLEFVKFIAENNKLDKAIINDYEKKAEYMEKNIDIIKPHKNDILLRLMLLFANNNDFINPHNIFQVDLEEESLLDNVINLKILKNNNSNNDNTLYIDLQNEYFIYYKSLNEGRCFFVNNCIFEGDFVNHKPANGKFYYPTGEMWKGEYNGLVTFYANDGLVLQGRLHNNSFEGCVVFNFPNGDKAICECQTSRILGKGEYFFSTGSKWIGELTQLANPKGQGIFLFPDGRRWESQNYNCGHGIMHMTNGDRLKREMLDWGIIGQGEYIWNNGVKWRGNVAGGVLHGKGILQISNKEFEVEFSYNKRIFMETKEDIRFIDILEKNILGRHNFLVK